MTSAPTYYVLYWRGMCVYSIFLRCALWSCVDRRPLMHAFSFPPAGVVTAFPSQSLVELERPPVIAVRGCPAAADDRQFYPGAWRRVWFRVRIVALVAVASLLLRIIAGGWLRCTPGAGPAGGVIQHGRRSLICCRPFAMRRVNCWQRYRPTGTKLNIRCHSIHFR